MSAQTVRLQDFFKGAADIDVPLAQGLFIPDVWTETFADGLTRLARDGVFENSTVLEVGVGNGINMVGLLTTEKPPAHFIGTDIDKRAIEASERLADQRALFTKTSLRKSSLISTLCDAVLEQVDHVIACIPQVPAVVNLTEGDNFSHYYNSDGSRWDHYGLGLNARLIEQTNVRAPQARITLNLAGRPSKGVLKRFFEEYKRTPEFIHDRMVRHHAPTSITPLAELEEKGAPDFEFFHGPDDNEQINARQAAEIRAQEIARGDEGTDIHHKVYVVSAPALERRPC